MLGALGGPVVEVHGVCGSIISNFGIKLKVTLVRSYKSEACEELPLKKMVMWIMHLNVDFLVFSFFSYYLLVLDVWKLQTM